MIRVIQTIALENGSDFEDYDFFKTRNGDYGFFNGAVKFEEINND